MTAIQEVQLTKTASEGHKGVLDDTIIKSLYKNLLQLDNSLANGCRNGNRSIKFLQ